jgi:hypothetical protein
VHAGAAVALPGGPGRGEGLRPRHPVRRRITFVADIDEVVITSLNGTAELRHRVVDAGTGLVRVERE